MFSEKLREILVAVGLLSGLFCSATIVAAPGPEGPAARSVATVPSGVGGGAGARAREASAAAKTVRVRLGDLADSAAIGPEDAPVTITAVMDYECPYCARSHETLEKLTKQFGDKVRIVFKHNPLAYHANAKFAAQAALAAMDLGRFPEMHRTLLSHQKELQSENLTTYAAEAGLDTEEFEAALHSGAFADAVDADIAWARRVGVTATPFFFVNGRPLRGAQPLPTFAAIVDEELGGSARSTRWVDRVEGPQHQPEHLAKAKKARRAKARALAARKSDGASNRLILQKLAEMQREIHRLNVEIVVLRKSVADLKRGESLAAEVAGEK